MEAERARQQIAPSPARGSPTRSVRGAATEQATRPAPAATRANAVLALQRAIGNRAVARRVKIGKAIGSHDKPAARAKAEELRAVRERGKWGTAQEERTAHWLAFFEGEALHVFIGTLAYTDNEETVHGGRTFNDPKGRDFTVGRGTAIFPLSKPRETRNGFKVTYFAQVIAEDSESTSVEVYSEVYGSVEAAVQLPIKKVFVLKAGVGKKWGKKKATKDESKTSRRVGMTISRNFKIKKLERDVFQIDYIERAYGVRMEPWEEDPEAWEDTVHPLPAGRLATKVTSHHVGTNPQVQQQGWRIEAEEGGAPWGPFWNRYYDFVQVKGSALADVWEVLTEQQREMAETLVFGE